MSKVRAIAKREFLVTVTRKGYLVALFGMPLLFGGMFAITFFFKGVSGDFKTHQGPAGAQGDSRADQVPAGVVDRARILDFSLAVETEETSGTDGLPSPGSRSQPLLVPYGKLDEALADLRKGDRSIVFLLEANYLQSGEIIAYSLEEDPFSRPILTHRGRLNTLIRASLASGHLEEATLQRVLAPGRIKPMQVSKEGKIQSQGKIQPQSRTPSQSGMKRAGQFLGPFILFFLFTLSIFFSSGYLLQGIAEEKQNRVIEILLSSVTPTELLMGKMLGLGAAGLLQVAFYVILLILPASLILAILTVSIGQIFLSFVYVVLGYILFASLMAATGLLGNTSQESQQLSIVWTMTAMIPIFLLGPFSEQPHSWLAQSLCYFPLTAPVTMLLRLSTGNVPAMDVLVSLAVLLVGIFLAVKGASRIFRTASLMYGKRPGLKEICRWLKEA